VAQLYRFHSRSKATEDLVRQFSSRADVIYAEPNFVVQAVQQPNDPRFAELWGLHNSGQGFGFPAGTAGADIGALEAWSFSTGTTGHVVAVVDTGIDYTHPDLQANIWSAPSAFAVTIAGSVVNCPAGSHGFNAITLACDPMDDNKHGTHVSGTIGAAGNNGQGVVGVNWTTRLMGIKFLDSSGYGYISDAVNAIEFAIQAKNAFGAAADVRVLSNSWGGGGFSQALLDEIKRAGDNNMLFVAAAGNNGYNNDLSAFYPASYNAPNLIAVAATDNNDSLASFSNYGPTGVHLGAPGVNILSTVLGGQYGYLSGTSMAVPHVSGAAALVLSRCALNTPALKANLTEQVDLVPALNTITASGGRLNVNNALRDCTAPVGVSPGALAFARQVVATVSAPKTVTVTNRQAVSLAVTGISINGDFLQSNTCGQSVMAGGTCKITVTYNPTAVGYASGTLTLTHNAANNHLTVPLSGYGIVPAAVAPLNINFAGVVLGSSSRAQYVKLTNNQSTALSIIGVTMTGAFTQTNTCGTALGPLQSCNVLVTFTPVALGAHSGTLTLRYNASNSPQTVTLAGTGVSRVTLSPATLDFGGVVVGNVSLSRSASLMNNQKSASLAITSISASGDFTQTNNCGTQLGPSLTCVINVTFKPAAMGVRSGSVVIASNVPESPHVLALSGTGLGQPDLTESSVSALGTLAVGKSTQVSDTTVNQGAGNAGSSTTRFYLSATPSAAPVGMLLSGTRSVPGLAAGASSSGTATVTISPYFPPGSYYLLACADDTRYVIESNENNNCVSSSSVLRVEGPDLVEKSVSVNGPLALGKTASVTDTILNQGLANAGSSITRYYLSTTVSNSPAGVLLSGSRAVPALAAEGSSAGTATVTISPYVPVGSYYVLACADANNYVAETNENNNCAASALLQVTAQ
jgi:subtilisin family serine protease